MRFESRTFWLSKDADEPTQYQDAFELDPELGRAAIADGVSSAIFSGPWAKLLTLAAVADPPPLEDASSFPTWIADKRAAWLNTIDISHLTWYQRPKMADGAMTTLLWLELAPTETNADGRAICYQLNAYAIGDSCLFHVRGGEALYWFPLNSSGEFGLNPAVVGSVDRQLDHLLEFKARSQECLIDDLLVLATDAIALWAVEQAEAGNPVDWSRYWDLTDDEWRTEIFAHRDAKQMRFDDSTLVLLRAIEERPAPVPEPLEATPLEAAALAEEPLATDNEVLRGEVAQPAGDEPEVEPTEELPEPAVASMTDAVEASDGMRFDAPAEEAVESLETPESGDAAEKSPEMLANEPAGGDTADDNGPSTVAAP